MNLLMKKHWKPPYVVFFLVFFVPCSTECAEVKPERVEVDIVATPYTLTFSVKDSENYELESVICKASQAPVANTCVNLDPCIKHSVVLNIRSDTETFQQLAEAYTLYATPEVEILTIESSADTILINWTATEKTCIASFDIEAKSVYKSFETKLTNNKLESLLIESLYPCAEYAIQFKTFDVNQILLSNLTSKTTTDIAEPGSLTASTEDFEDAQVKVRWEQPENHTCIDYYYLRWFIKGCSKNEIKTSRLNDNGTEVTQPNKTETESGVNACEWFANITDVSAKEYVLSGLQGCEMYGLEIYINNIETAKSKNDFKSPEQVPGIVVPKTSEIGAKEITLHWDVPSASSKCVRGYEIILTGPLQKDEMKPKRNETTETKINFSKLDPCGQYNYTITAISLNGTAGVPLETQLETAKAQPSKVRNAKIIADPNSIKVSWDSPEFADLCLDAYRLVGWRSATSQSSDFDKVTNETFVVIDDLYSCQSYTVQIIATATDMEGELVVLETETSAIVAPQPSNFQVIGHYSDALELGANNLEGKNKCGVIFANFTCVAVKSSVDPIYKTAEKYVEGQVGGLSFFASLTPLSPNTGYQCFVSFYNSAGWSQNDFLLDTTRPYFPDRPEDVKAESSTNSSLQFSWKPPKYANGKIALYFLHFQRVEAAYYIPPICTPIISDSSLMETASVERKYINLEAFTTYSIQIAAKNEYGIGEYSRPFLVTTSPWISEPVIYFKVKTEGPHGSDEEYKANVVVTWRLPCKSNGEIEYFSLEFNGERENHTRHAFKRSVQPKFDEVGAMVHNETELKPQYKYSVLLRVATKGVNDTSADAHVEFEAPAGIPKRLDETTAGKAKVDAYAANNPTTSAMVRFPAAILETESGTIMFVALLLSQKGCNPPPQLRYGALDSIQQWTDTLSWNDAYEDPNTNCINQYQTTPVRWNPKDQRVALSEQAENIESSPLPQLRYVRSTDEIEYIIGTDKCHGTSKRYCNGPLKPNTDYHLVIRLFTNSGYNDAVMLQFKTDALIQLMIILVSVSSCLLLALIAGFIYLWMMKRAQWKRESCHGIEDSFGAVLAKNFAMFYCELSRPDKIMREFNELTAVAMDLSFTASELGYYKNRYADIFPYDKNRVILDFSADGSDYINASFIAGYRRKKEYIATQGPKPESTMDFWRMVLQHNVRVIVMVTQFREGSVVKCHEYFPFTSKGINVVIKRKDSFEIYDRTEMTVTHDKYSLKQKVVHFYFKKWPDHGCPSDPLSLITFVRKVKAEKLPKYSPIVVHCSAGVGRTGTFIGLDIIMQRLKTESKINIYETVRKLRFQRMKMVQTLAQYTFLYACSYELVKHKATPTKQQQNLMQICQNNNNNNGKRCNFSKDAVGNMSPNKLYSPRNIAVLNSLSEYQEKERKPNSIRFNGLRKGSDLESLDEEHLEDTSNESVM